MKNLFTFDFVNNTMEKSMKTALDMALDDIFKDWK